MLFEIIIISLIALTISDDYLPNYIEEELVEQFNYARKKIARERAIPGLNELVLDTELCNANSKNIHKTHRVTFFKYESSREFDYFKQLTDQFLSLPGETQKRYIAMGVNMSILGLEHVVPEQKTVCCSSFYDEGFPNENMYCLFAPEGKLGWWVDETEIDCDKIYIDVDGLCKEDMETTEIPTTVEPSTTSTSTSPPTTSEDYEDDTTTSKIKTISRTSSLKPVSTTMSEMDEKIKKYKDTETDGDEVEVEQFEDYEDSSNAIPFMITVIVVVFKLF